MNELESVAFATTPSEAPWCRCPASEAAKRTVVSQRNFSAPENQRVRKSTSQEPGGRYPAPVVKTLTVYPRYSVRRNVFRRMFGTRPAMRNRFIDSGIEILVR
jgi:hypothetical protein